MIRADRTARRTTAASFALVAVAATARGQATEQWYFEPSVGTSSQRFGLAMAIRGDRLVVGAPYDDTLISNGGAVHVQVWDPAARTWTLEQQLFPSDPELSASFGASVAIDGDLIVVGSHLNNTGAGTDAGQAYVFRRDATTGVWSEEQILVPSSAAASDQFGVSVAVSGDAVLVGAPNSDTAAGLNSGSAFVFRYQNSTVKWVEETQLIDPDGKASDGSGLGVALEGTLAAVGSYRQDEGGKANAGSVGIWSFDGSVWSQVQELTRATPQTSGEFGTRVRLWGDLLAVTAPSEDESSTITNSGAAYLFRRVAGSFVEEARFAPPVPADNLYFGTDVAARNDVVLVGDQSEDVSGRADAGAAHLFRHSKKAGWVWDQRLTASNSTASDRLGAQVAIHDSLLLAAADGRNITGKGDWGALYGWLPEEITLTIEPTSPVPDETITFKAIRGPVGDVVMVTVEDVSGTPLFLPVIVFTFASDGAFTFTANAPNPAYGLHVGMRAYKISPLGPVVFSELAYVDV